MGNSNYQITRKMMLSLLPVQIILAAVSAVNSIVSSYFASNFIGIDVMSAVGLYSPVSMLLGAIASVMSGGSAIMCGKYLGQNQNRKLQDMFSLDLLLTFIVSAVFTVLFVMMGIADLTGIFTQDEVLRPIFNRYLIGQSAGIIPMMLGNQLPMFLTTENKSKRTLVSSVVYIFVNLVFNYIFVEQLKLGAFGLALASSLGMWVFLIMEIQYFMTRKSNLKIRIKKIDWKEAGNTVSIGWSCGESYLYMALRGLAVNKLLEIYTGSMGISAFATANNVMGIFWAIPSGMAVVSRLLISVAIGEEDRQTLGDIMRVMYRCYIPIMCAVDVVIILMADPLTGVFYSDPSVPVYAMMRSGLRILPLCMPLAIICMHFSNYSQIVSRDAYNRTLSILDGAADVAFFSYLLTGWLGVDGVYIANVLNGVVTTLFIIGYAWFKLKRVPKNMEDLLVLPDEFGVDEDDRIDISVRTIKEVVTLSEQIQKFCVEKGIDSKRSYLSALALEEMAANIVEQGFTKDNREHTIYVRVVHKDDNVILRIRDDCLPFNPEDRKQISENEDITKNIGVRMIYKILKDISYQFLFGMNVLTIKI